MANYMMASRFYCAACRATFFIPRSLGYIKGVLHCPLCGEHRAKFTSEGWWVEKEYKKTE